ncbi:MAG: MFS transporter [Gammaproteobacteria bacterium]
MTSTERTATFSLASLFVARMLGLFMVLPVLSLYAAQLHGATPLLIGMAVGIYGITQASLQIPFGMLSDRYNRKIIIAAGFIFFVLGSILAATADSITQMIIGRALQGASAVGGATIALATDLTREQERPKAMAIIGIMIGGSFSVAMMVGPVLSQWTNVDGLFWISASLGLVGLAILAFLVPPAPPTLQHNLSSWVQLKNLIAHPVLMRVNLGVFILHTVLTANFVVLPILLRQQPYIYIPVLITVLFLLIPLLKIARQTTLLHPLSLGAIFLLLIAEILFLTPLYIGFSLIIFFTAFTFLEASLPSLISHIAPSHSKGAAMGIYTCFQFLGIFVGGIAGGFIYGHYSAYNVFIFCAILATMWLIYFSFMREPNHGTRH